MKTTAVGGTKVPTVQKRLPLDEVIAGAKRILSENGFEHVDIEALGEGAFKPVIGFKGYYLSQDDRKFQKTENQIKKELGCFIRTNSFIHYSDGPTRRILSPNYSGFSSEELGGWLTSSRIIGHRSY